jgi:hypothetical protein
MYLFSRELEVDLSRSDVDDRVSSVEERSSKDDGCIVFYFPMSRTMKSVGA